MTIAGQQDPAVFDDHRLGGDPDRGIGHGPGE
jgi:hypothetical protein